MINQYLLRISSSSLFSVCENIQIFPFWLEEAHQSLAFSIVILCFFAFAFPDSEHENREENEVEKKTSIP
jgi:hypothetical protein